MSTLHGTLSGGTAVSRRRFVTGACLSGAGLCLSGCLRRGKEEEGLSAVEDLMREHGVLRRALLVYAEAVPRLAGTPPAGIAGALQKTATLFRAFGENYHERTLEEQFVFPALRKAPGPLPALVDTLIAQHERGRDITAFVLAVTTGGTLAGDAAAALARQLAAFVRMYQNHAAREDTVVFPAWKKAMPADQIEELGEQFEEIEHEQVGEGGFDDAVRQIEEIEALLGLENIAQFTAPQPPGA
ncbi:hemerythrin domain-containing protein [bacterium]|nr:hemerythrin domain-containing protein [bacterium]